MLAILRDAQHGPLVWEVDRRGLPPQPTSGIRALFDAVHSLVAGFGPVPLVPYRDRIAFMERVRFAGVRPRLHWLDVEFWSPGRVESARLRKVETLSPYFHIPRDAYSSIECPESVLLTNVEAAVLVDAGADKIPVRVSMLVLRTFPIVER